MANNHASSNSELLLTSEANCCTLTGKNYRRFWARGNYSRSKGIVYCVLMSVTLLKENRRLVTDEPAEFEK